MHSREKRKRSAFANAARGKRRRHASAGKDSRELQKIWRHPGAVVLAVGVTIGAVVGAITNALKATGKAIGRGLKQIVASLGSLLPGLIGQVARFLFNTVAKAVGFLGEHSWLLILAAGL